MVVDSLVVLAFLGGMYGARAYLIMIAVCTGVFLLELFSPLPFGFVSITFFISLFVGRFLRMLFDGASYTSWMISFLFAFASYALLHGVAYAVLTQSFTVDMLMRTAVLFVRWVVLGVTLVGAILGIRYSIFLIRHAVEEQKIT